MGEYTPPTPLEGFLDPDDPILFPRLTAAQIERLAESAETLSLSPGEIVFKQGQRDAPLFVVLSGAIDVIDRQPEAIATSRSASPAPSPPTPPCSPASRRSPAASPPRRPPCWPSLPTLRALVAGAAELGSPPAHHGHTS